MGAELHAVHGEGCWPCARTGYRAWVTREITPPVAGSRMMRCRLDHRRTRLPRNRATDGLPMAFE